MRSKWNIICGLLLVVLGGFFLLDGIFGWRADFGDFLGFLWPVALIVLGVYLFRRNWRGRREPAGAQRYTKVFGDLKIDDSNFSPGGLDAELGIGDVKINLSGSAIPDGEHQIKINAGVGDIAVIIPRELPVSARAGTGIGTIRLLDRKSSGLGSQSSVASEGYRQARRKLSIIVKVGIGDIDLTRSET